MIKKMKLLLLPGANPKTIAWLESLTQALNINPTKSYLHKYVFWEETDSTKTIKKEASGIPTNHYDLVIAKSFGSLVLLEATTEKQISWKRAIVFGIPLKIVKDTKFNQAGFSILKKENILVVQQKNDILGAAHDLQQYCSNNLKTIEGSDHQYDEYNLFKSEVSNWLKNEKVS